MKLSLVPKFTKKVTISDIKQYLVDEFKKSDNQQKQIEELKDKLKSALELEIKYNATLITLDEYKKRLEDREKRIIKLDKDIEKLQKEVIKIEEQKNNEILKYKKLDIEYIKLKNSFDEEVDNKANSIKKILSKEHHMEVLKINKQKEEFIKEKINTIKSKKGTLSKAKVIEILEEK